MKQDFHDYDPARMSPFGRPHLPLSGPGWMGRWDRPDGGSLDDLQMKKTMAVNLTDEERELLEAYLKEGSHEVGAGYEMLPMPRPVAWLHTMHMESGQTDERVTFDEEHNWGEVGYPITSEPLYRRPSQ